MIKIYFHHETVSTGEIHHSGISWIRDYAEQCLYEQRRSRVLAKREAHRERMRMERNTAPALGAPRRQGRL